MSGWGWMSSQLTSKS